MKILVSIAAFAMAASVFAADPVTSTTLQARAHAGEPDNYADACFSFYYMSHDQNVTGNDYDIEFNGTSLHTNQVVDNIGAIVDLGSISCKDVKNSYEQTGQYPGKGHGGYPYKEDRKLDPMFWFEYSEAMDKLTRGPVSSEIEVQAGHCYALNKITNSRRILSMFHVKGIDPNKSVTLDELEVIKRQEISDKSN